MIVELDMHFSGLCSRIPTPNLPTGSGSAHLSSHPAPRKPCARKRALERNPNLDGMLAYTPCYALRTGRDEHTRSKHLGSVGVSGKYFRRISLQSRGR
jgi:hypothetical protein